MPIEDNLTCKRVDVGRYVCSKRCLNICPMPMLIQYKFVCKMHFFATLCRNCNLSGAKMVVQILWYFLLVLRSVFCGLRGVFETEPLPPTQLSCEVTNPQRGPLFLSSLVMTRAKSIWSKFILFQKVPFL